LTSQSQPSLSLSHLSPPCLSLLCFCLGFDLPPCFGLPLSVSALISLRLSLGLVSVPVSVSLSAISISASPVFHICLGFGISLFRSTLSSISLYRRLCQRQCAPPREAVLQRAESTIVRASPATFVGGHASCISRSWRFSIGRRKVPSHYFPLLLPHSHPRPRSRPRQRLPHIDPNLLQAAARQGGLPRHDNRQGTTQNPLCLASSRLCSIHLDLSSRRQAHSTPTTTHPQDDLTKDSQPGPDGMLHMTALGFSDGLRSSGKEDVISTYPKPHEPYGYYLANYSVPLENGTIVSAWDAHYACMKSSESKPQELCERTTFPDVHYEVTGSASMNGRGTLQTWAGGCFASLLAAIYSRRLCLRLHSQFDLSGTKTIEPTQDNWVTRNALKLLSRKPQDKPWFMQVGIAVHCRPVSPRPWSIMSFFTLVLLVLFPRSTSPARTRLFSSRQTSPSRRRSVPTLPPSTPPLVRVLRVCPSACSFTLQFCLGPMCLTPRLYTLPRSRRLQRQRRAGQRLSLRLRRRAGKP
jgi:hypothetical protein